MNRIITNLSARPSPANAERNICRSLLLAILLALVTASRLTAATPQSDYLSDCPELILSNTQDWGVLGFDTAAHAPGKEGAPLQIGEKRYEKGLGHHANGVITLLLDSYYESFDAEVGLQPCAGGSVVFRIFVDSQQRFDSGVMRSGDPPKLVHISVAGGQELRLEAKDAGDGISCDMANWADARLTPVPNIAKPHPAETGVDMAKFARVVTWDPNRTDGARASRIEEFRADDLFTETELKPDRNGNYAVPTWTNDLGCIGLQWLNRRALRELALGFASEMQMPPTDSVRVEGWFGESAWQGNWKPLTGELRREGTRLIFRLAPRAGVVQTQKIRWVLPVASKPPLVKLSAFTRSSWATTNLFVQIEKPKAGTRGEITIWNGERIGKPGSSKFSATRALSDFEANGRKFASFPLTLAFSPRRGNRVSRCEQIHEGNAPPRPQTILPLPKGEGRGEGKEDLRTPAMSAPKVARNRQSTIRNPQSATSWSLAQPLHLSVRYSRPSSFKSDPTVLQFRLPTGHVGVAVEDVLANDCVYLPDSGLFVAREPLPVTLADYKRRITGRQTILEAVRALPDQTLAQAMEKTHHDAQREGPVMLSLACDNAKFVVERDGTVRFQATTNIAKDWFASAGELRPQFGDTKDVTLTRTLDGGWLPIPVITREKDGLVCRQRNFVAPCDEVGGDPTRLNRRSVCVVEFTATNTLAATADASFSLNLLLNSRRKEPADLVPCPRGWLVRHEDREVALVAIEPESPLKVAARGGVLSLTGKLQPRQAASFAIYLSAQSLSEKVFLGSTSYQPVPPGNLPDGTGVTSMNSAGAGFVATPAAIPVGRLPTGAGRLPAPPIFQTGSQRRDLQSLPDVAKLRADTEAYWNAVLAPAMQIATPDSWLNGVIRSSQVRCLIAARNEAEGSRVAAWIAAMSYGPLESEAHSVIRGMDFMGHSDFARRSLDFFVHRYNTNGFLTTGYTTFGTAWHLWTLGEHYQLSHDKTWLRQVAPEIARVGHWIVRQTEKTRKLDARGQPAPEFGLMPPGVLADWNSYAYHFAMNAYYSAALRELGAALADIGHPDAAFFKRHAAELRANTLRAYAWTQSRSPALALRDGTWIPHYPSQVHSPGKLGDFFPGQDAGRSWCYDVELGAHQLVPTGVLEPRSREVERMMDHIEDVQFLADGWFDYSATINHADWFNLGGFSKVQPYYTRNCEIYALRDDVKPFIRSYFNTLAAMLNPEVLTMWEHFHHSGAWDKTHETGYFLHQTRTMLVQERGEALWLAPFATSDWLHDGQRIAVRNAPTRFGKVSFEIKSNVASGYIAATIEPQTLSPPKQIVVRLRHPDGRQIQSVMVNGRRHGAFDPANETVTLKPGAFATTLRAEF